MDQGPGVPPVQGSAESVERLGFRWIAELLNHGRTSQTGTAYAYALKSFGVWLNSYGIAPLNVTREDIEQWLSDQRLGKIDPATIRNRLGVARGLYTWLTARDYIPKNPFLGILRFKVPRRIPNFMSVPEVDQMAKGCASRRDSAIIETLYSTAARREGLLGIRLRDLNFEQGQVKITGKGGKEHFHQLTPRAIRAIKSWMSVRAKYPCLKRAPTDVLFISRRGPLSKTQLAGIVHAIASRAGMNRRITPHAFRHSHATHLKDRGVPLEEIQKVLDHANIQTTQIYDHTSTETMRDAWKRLPRR